MRLRLFLPLVALAGLLLMREAQVAPLDKVEAAFTALLSREAASQHEAEGRKRHAIAPVALLEINDEETGFKAWPWSPFDYSLAVHAALEFQPGLLAVEPVLTWEKANAQQVAVLHRLFLKAPRLVLNATLGGQEGSHAGEIEVPPLAFKGSHEDLAAIPGYADIAALPEESLRLTGKLGFSAASHGDRQDGRLPLVYRYRNSLVPSFVLQTAMQLYGVTAEETVVIPGNSIRLGKEIAIPIDREGAMPILFGAPIRRLAVSDLLLAAEQRGAGDATAEAVAKAAGIHGAVVLLGRTDAGAGKVLVENDVYTQAEVLAHALATIQEGSFLRSAPVFVGFVIIAAALGVAAWFFRIGKFWSVIAAIGLGSGYTLVSLWLATRAGIALPFVVPTGLLVFILGARQLQ